MARHLLRDYSIQTLTAAKQGSVQGYLLAIFMRRVLGYSVVGHTNFNIDTVGPFLLASGVGLGNRAGINFGAGAFYQVSIPSGIRVVAVGDIGRLICLRSTANPLFNSGVFLITGVNTTDNRYIVDYRSGDNPPAEAADSMDWWLYVSDDNLPVVGANNAGTGNQYRGNGTSTTARIILQSPHATGWQVRICLETSTDRSATGVPPISATPGFGGNSAGDFVGLRHTHVAQWYDNNTINYRGAIGIGSDSGCTGRITFCGDDTGQAVASFYRKVTGSLVDQLYVVGIPDNEPTPTPATDQRIFAYGNNNNATSSQYFNNISFNTNVAQTNTGGQGIGLGSGSPTFVSPSCWVYVTGHAGGAGPENDSLASDSPFITATELFTVELLAGTSITGTSSGAAVLQVDVRPMGTIPFIRMGRANFGNFTLTTDGGKTWQHGKNGVYLQWGGPAVVP